ncbi:MAG: rhodanese-like domain-containing protein [Solirubrobacteraceae bacterium]|nr:rhodanese-like domain-containing protein [Solirubrobacteraceae bacterium]
MAELRILTSADLYELMLQGEEIQVLDVRTPEEFAAGRIDGSVLVPYDQVATWPEELDPAIPTAVICKAGVRAVHAAAVLDRLTDGELYVIAQGGVGDWPRLGGELTAG